jgi:hypothetical protein
MGNITHKNSAGGTHSAPAHGLNDNHPICCSKKALNWFAIKERLENKEMDFLMVRYACSSRADQREPGFCMGRSRKSAVRAWQGVGFGPLFIASPGESFGHIKRITMA